MVLGVPNAIESAIGRLISFEMQRSPFAAAVLRVHVEPMKRISQTLQFPKRGAIPDVAAKQRLPVGNGPSTDGLSAGGDG